MKLYLVIQGEDYETDDIVGVYSTLEQADEIADLFRKKNDTRESCYTVVKEVILDELTDVGKWLLGED